MKNTIFVFSTFLFFTLFTTDTFAQGKVKKGKLKTKQAILNQPALGEWRKDTVSHQKQSRNQSIKRNNGMQPSLKSRGGMTKGPTVQGSIWDTLPPQVKGGKMVPKLKKQQSATQNGQSARRNNPNQIKGQSMEKNPGQIKMRPNKRGNGSKKAIQKREKANQKSNSNNY